MSYDFELYIGAKRELAGPPILKRGNISFDGPDRAEEEDIPASFLPVVGKKRWLYRIHLEGQIERKDQTQIHDWLRSAVVESKGVLIDLQTEKYETPNRSGIIKPIDEAIPEAGKMSFYFEDGEGFYEYGFESMLDRIADIFPEALPVRYGYYEPLQGRVEQGQYAEIVTAFHKATDLYMKSPAPFGYIYMSIPCKKTFESFHPQHFIRRNYLLSRVEFELGRKLFENPSHLSTLLKLFKALCVDLNVVYAEILQSDEPGTAWFWYGLPDRKTAHTICVGPAYQKVWPEISKLGEVVGKQHRVITVDLFDNKPPRPPLELRAPEQVQTVDRDPRSAPTYAPVFPFDYKFDYGTYIW